MVDPKQIGKKNILKFQNSISFDDIEKNEMEKKSILDRYCILQLTKCFRKDDYNTENTESF